MTDVTPPADIGPSDDPTRPVAIRFAADPEHTHKLTREEAWHVWHLLQAELVRTLPNPPSYRPQVIHP